MSERPQPSPITEAEIYLGSRPQGLRDQADLYMGYTSEAASSLYIGQDLADIIARPEFRNQIELGLTQIQIKVTHDRKVLVAKVGTTDFKEITFSSTPPEVITIANKTQNVFERMRTSISVEASCPISPVTPGIPTPSAAPIAARVTALEGGLASTRNALAIEQLRNESRDLRSLLAHPPAAGSDLLGLQDELRGATTPADVRAMLSRFDRLQGILGAGMPEELETKARALREQLAATEGALGGFCEANDALNDALQALRGELQALHDKDGVNQAKVAELEAQLAPLYEALGDAESLEEAQQVLGRLEATIATLKGREDLLQDILEADDPGDLASPIIALRDRANDLQEAFAASEKRKAELHSALGAEITDLTQQLEDRGESSDALQEKLEQAQNNLVLLTQKIALLEERATPEETQQLTDELAVKTQEVESLTQRLTEQSESSEGLREQLEQANTAREELAEQVALLQRRATPKETEEREAEILALRQDSDSVVTAAAKRIRLAEAKAKRLQEELVVAQATAGDRQGEIDTLSGRIEGLAAEAETLRSTIAEQKEVIRRQESSIGSQAEEIAAAKEENQRLAATFAEHEQEIAKLKEEVTQLKADKARLEEALAGLTSLLGIDVGDAPPAEYGELIAREVEELQLNQEQLKEAQKTHLACIEAGEAEMGAMRSAMQEREYSQREAEEKLQRRVAEEQARAVAASSKLQGLELQMHQAKEVGQAMKGLSAIVEESGIELSVDLIKDPILKGYMKVYNSEIDVDSIPRAMRGAASKEIKAIKKAPSKLNSLELFTSFFTVTDEMSKITRDEDYLALMTADASMPPGEKKALTEKVLNKLFNLVITGSDNANRGAFKNIGKHLWIWSYTFNNLDDNFYAAKPQFKKSMNYDRGSTIPFTERTLDLTQAEALRQNVYELHKSFHTLMRIFATS